MKYGTPMPRLASAARPTSGSEKIERKQPAVEREADGEHHRQRDQEDTPFCRRPCIR